MGAHCFWITTPSPAPQLTVAGRTDALWLIHLANTVSACPACTLTSIHGFHKINSVEKRAAHYDLTETKATLFKRDIDSFTTTALLGIDAIGITQAQGLREVLNMQRNMLFKKMTPHADYGVWQDVCHALCPNGRTAFIIGTLQLGATVIQFKEQ